MLRRCWICKEYKESSEFGKDKSKFLGLNNRCKTCDKKRSVKLYPYRVFRYDIDRKKAYRKTEKGRNALNTASKRAYVKHKEKWVARAKLRYAVKKGLIGKMPCEVCSDTDITTIQVQAHHYKGYEGENWKHVQWLCTTHHAKEHRLRKTDFKIV